MNIGYITKGKLKYKDWNTLSLRDQLQLEPKSYTHKKYMKHTLFIEAPLCPPAAHVTHV